MLNISIAPPCGSFIINKNDLKSDVLTSQNSLQNLQYWLSCSSVEWKPTMTVQLPEGEGMSQHLPEHWCLTWSLQEWHGSRCVLHKNKKQHPSPAGFYVIISVYHLSVWMPTTQLGSATVTYSCWPWHCGCQTPKTNPCGRVTGCQVWCDTHLARWQPGLSDFHPSLRLNWGNTGGWAGFHGNWCWAGFSLFNTCLSADLRKASWLDSWMVSWML